MSYYGDDFGQQQWEENQAYDDEQRAIADANAQAEAEAAQAAWEVEQEAKEESFNEDMQDLGKTPWSGGF